VAARYSFTNRVSGSNALLA